MNKSRAHRLVRVICIVCEFISILHVTGKQIKNMNESFRVYNDSADLNRVLVFPVTLVWTEKRILRMFWTSTS